jgi:hypothetical protein
MRADGRAPSLLSPSFFVSLRGLRARLAGMRFGGPELSTRFALVILALAAMTVTRCVTFLDQVPTDELPPWGPLRWLFHVADMAFLPGGNRLPNLNRVQQVQFGTLIIALVLFFLAARPRIPRLVMQWHRPLLWCAVLLTPLLVLLNLQGMLPFAAVAGSHHYGNDAITVTACGADELLRGHNPYVSFSVIPCLDGYGQDGTRITPLKAGAFAHYMPYPPRTQLLRVYEQDRALKLHHPVEIESYYSYPAFSFLFPAIFDALHLKDLSLVYLLVYLAAGALIVRDAPPGAARKMAVTALAANAALGPTLVSGSTDGLYTALVLLAWTSRERRWLSALAMGLAVASRQQAWFFLVFYAVLVWQTSSRQEMLRRLAIVAGVFALVNAPYFIAAPSAWLTSVLGPIRDPMFPRGSGIVALSTGGSGAWRVAPKALYTALELGALTASVAYYWRTCRTSPWTGLVLAPLALFFAWRSLYSYFLPLSLFVLYPAFVVYARPQIDDAASLPRSEAAEAA